MNTIYYIIELSTGILLNIYIPYVLINPNKPKKLKGKKKLSLPFLKRF